MRANYPKPRKPIDISDYAKYEKLFPLVQDILVEKILGGTDTLVKDVLNVVAEENING